MNVIEQRIQELTKGRLTIRTQWEQSAVGQNLHRWLDDPQQVITLTQCVRWGTALAPLLPALFIAVATVADSPDVVNPGLEFQPGSVLASWALLWTLPAFIYLSRHVPVPGYYPNCPKCLRKQETLHARLRGRHTCGGCGKSLTELMDNDVVPAARRAWRSL